MEPALRGAAELGAWQVISPGEVTGRVVVVPHLSEVQDDVYEDPTVLVVDTVSGEEEIPATSILGRRSAASWRGLTRFSLARTMAAFDW